ncbi:hypothetical protein KCU65_g1930, partial [Aureobasidium melanogenum]
MPKNKKPTRKQRQIPYPTPPRPASNVRSSRAVPSIPGARNFPPPTGFTPAVPNPAYPECELTPEELNQSLVEFARNRQTSTKPGPLGVDKDDPSSTDHDSGDEGNIGGESDHSELEGAGSGGQKTKNPLDQSTDDENNPQLPGIHWLPGPSDPPRLPNPPQGSSDLHYPTPEPLTEDEKWLKELEPVIKYNEETPWPVSFYEQPFQAPAWYSECPEGYEPTTLAGYPIRRQYPTYIPAAHDSELVRHQYGHYCLDLRETREWDQCCMGKCEGCEICRPGL